MWHCMYTGKGKVLLSTTDCAIQLRLFLQHHLYASQNRAQKVPGAVMTVYKSGCSGGLDFLRLQITDAAMG